MRRCGLHSAARDFSPCRGESPVNPESAMDEKSNRAPVPAPQSISIELGEKEAEGIYSNLCVISHSSSEVILDFARTMPGINKTRVHARIIMTPQHAKSLLGALGTNLAKFEEQFGVIPAAGPDGRLDRDKKGIGF
jgi:hypothetical protein